MLRILSNALRGLGRSASIDGKISGGDIWVALMGMLALTVCLAVAGASLELLLLAVAISETYSGRGVLLGVAIGALLGSLLAAARIALDLTWRPSPPVTEVSSYTLEPDEELERAPLSFGIEIEVIRESQVLRSTILEELERSDAVRIVQKVAIALQRGKSFSRRQAAQHFGDYLSDTREEFVRLGLLVKAGRASNAGYKLTDLGDAFFDLCLSSPFPRDPIVLELE